ncbi:hypothetical protein Fcan01_25220 [Folsomia candida]|uniref:Uncharacterized protein n=1 Tax=Folsomia candida TaxID=158441 RepID=A0A226D3R1_FOLCA|nr:hypothetical protein Fcan01_25220 [Folsomia candida]
MFVNLTSLLTLVRGYFIFSGIAFSFVAGEWGNTCSTYDGYPFRDSPPTFCCNGTQISENEISEMEATRFSRKSISKISNSHYFACQKEVSSAYMSDNISVYLWKLAACMYRQQNNGTKTINYSDFVSWKERTVNYTTNKTILAAILDRGKSMCPEAAKKSEFYKKFQILENCYYSNIEKEAIKVHWKMVRKEKTEFPWSNCPRLPVVFGYHQTLRCCRNETLPWMVDDLLGFQMSSLQAGEPYEKCLHSVKNFVNTSVEGGPGKCLEACAFNPIDWKEISEKRDIVWNATYFLDYLLNSINITHVKNNLTTKANQQFKFARLPNEGILRNTNDSITFADMEKEYKSVNTPFNKSVEIYCRYYYALRGLAGSSIVDVSE